MVTASPEQQRQLLDLQKLDRTLAQYAHQRRSHPSIADLEEIKTRLDDLERAHIELETILSDIGRELRQAETGVEQVEQRTTRQRERLESGQLSAKDSMAVSQELEVLINRRGNLEEIQLEVMERYEETETKLNDLQERVTAMETQYREQSGVQAEAFKKLDEEIDVISKERTALAETLPADLIDLYDYIRSRTGGLAVVPVKNGQATDGMVLSLSLTERAALAAAPEDQVYEAEEAGYILVRMD